MKIKRNEIATDERPQTVTETVKELRGQFARHGSYNAEDIRRVLGDPQEVVKVEIVSDFALRSSSEE